MAVVTHPAKLRHLRGRLYQERVRTPNRSSRLAAAVAALALWACQENNPSAKALVGPGDASAPPTSPAADAGEACVAGAVCDDGDPCTEDDRCADDGRCVGAARDCDDGDPCTMDACDLSSGECRHAPAPRMDDEGAPGSAACEDGRDQDCDGRTDLDDPDCRVCTTGAECPPGDACTAVRCEAGRCVATQQPDGGACDDGDQCTRSDVCRRGVCVGDERVVCDDLSVEAACSKAACNPGTGQCEAVPQPDGQACDDGDACTRDDDCRSGRCGGAPVDCRMLDGACVVGVCDAGSGGCRAVSRADETPCGGDACLAAGACAAGVCTGAATDCSMLDGPCRVGRCDPETGGCDVAAAPDGTGCDDGDACTVSDACVEGQCAGRRRACDDLGGPCTTSRCDPAQGVCIVEPVPDGSGCDDGVACTEGDRCEGGLCLGVARACAGGVDAACFVGRCDEALGACALVPAAAGKPCDDGDRCTLVDACDGVEGLCTGTRRDCDDGDACTEDTCADASGACVHVPRLRAEAEGPPGGAECGNGVDDDCDGRADADDPDCRACSVEAECQTDDGDCRTYACEDGRCVGNAVARNGLACDDGNGCTQGDLCNDGACRGRALDCAALDGPCGRGLCDPALGRCVPETLGDGAACEDGDACTVDDVCAAGVCGGGRRDCSAFDGECLVGRCDPGTGACRPEPRAEGAPCADGDPCTVRDVCAGGVCGGEAALCEAPQNPCEVSVCDPASGACGTRNVEDGVACDDGDPCTVETACSAGACVGRPRDCGALDSACTQGVCDAETGDCRPRPRVDGTPCDDGRICSDADVCQGGLCLGAEVDCSALDTDCLAGVCDPSDGRCVTAPVLEGTRCDDAQACTVNDRCLDGVCGGSAVDCAALDSSCTVGACDPATGACVQSPRNEGGACDDGQACTNGDSCEGGRCAGAGLDCRDLDGPCVVGQCDAAGECVSVPVADGAPCDAQDLCAARATCEAGACVVEPRDCGALDATCEVGVCDGRTGACVSEDAEDGAPCDDEDPCTVEDSCTDGACTAVPRDCSAFDGPCTVGVCDPASGGCFAAVKADGLACDSGDPCRVAEACLGGVCLGSARDCSGVPGQSACRVGVCNPNSGACELGNSDDGTACDDGLYCTTNDVCGAGVCGGRARDCNPAGEPCRAGVCNEGSDRCDVGNVRDGTACEDGQYCTTGDRCVFGICRPRADRNCDDGNSGCREGYCDEGNDRCDQRNASNGKLCLDGNLCTFRDSCQNGVCNPGRNVCP